MKYYKVIFTLMLIVLSAVGVQAQCENKISVSSKVIESSSKGFIEVDITSNSKFTCVLNFETAEGSTIVEERKGNGNKKYQFSNLDLSKLYSVEVSFSGSRIYL